MNDYVDIYVNNEMIGSYTFGQESNWVDVSKKLVYGKGNSFAVIVRNSPYEGTGVRLEMRIGAYQLEHTKPIGAYQYERSVIRNDWTGEGPAFTIGVSIPVNDRGEARFNGDNVQSLGPMGEPHCDAP